MNTYQIILDVWEGNPDLDAEALKTAGVAGLIVRLNDMNGGHHMDERFVQDWAFALQFPVQSIYFVYNPWVSGKANFDWLVAHLPSDFGNRRLLIDTEVKYPGYSPDVYAKETGIFYGLVGGRYSQAIYTGAWFLPLVSKWPATIDYWWAAYPDALQGHKTWESFKAAVEKMVYANWTENSPGLVQLWQCSGGGDVLPGFGSHGVDVSVFPGTLDECEQWFHIPGDAERPGEPSHEDHGTEDQDEKQGEPSHEDHGMEDQDEKQGEPVMAWRENPHVLTVYHGQTVDVQEARRQGYSAIAAYLSEGDVKVDRSWLRDLSDKCKGVVPLLPMWSVIPAYEGYSQGEPTAQSQVDALMFTLEGVEYSGVVMNVESCTKWQTTTVATPSNIGSAAQAFYNTVAHLTGKPVYIRMTDDFVQKHTVDGTNRFMSWIQGKPYWIAEHSYRIVAGADTKWFAYPTGKVAMTLDEIRKRVYAPDTTHTPPDESRNPLVPENAAKKFWEFSWALHVPTGIVTDAYGKPSNAAIALSFAPDEPTFWAELNNFSQTPTVPVPVDPGTVVDPGTPSNPGPQLDRIETKVNEMYAILTAIKNI